MLAFVLPALADDDDEVLIEEAPDVMRARAEITRALGPLGYRDAGRKGDARRLVASTPWKPMVLLYDDGWVDIRRRPPLLVNPVEAYQRQTRLWRVALARDEGGPRSEEERAAVAAVSGQMLVCDVWTGLACFSPAGWLVSRKRVAQVEADVYEQAEEEIARWREAVAADHSARRLAEDVPRELAALWAADAPAAERHARLYTWWDTRAEGPAGDAAREACVTFLHTVVQASDAPFTPAELDALNAGRASTDPLVLFEAP